MSPPSLPPSSSSTGRTKAFLAATLAVSLVSLLCGCATTDSLRNPRDPFEGLNRAVFDLNDGIDKVIIRPVAQGYETVLPSPVRRGVTNFFGNLGDVFIAVNNLLQGKPAEAASDVGRFALNTTVGVLGIFDVATDLGLEKHEEDFGQTFGHWGMDAGPYLVLPLLGPSTLRDGAGLIADLGTDPLTHVDHVRSRNTLAATRIINQRAAILPTDKIVEEAALDRYTYIRDAYLQRRRSLIYDGDAPREPEDDGSSPPQVTAPTFRTRLERVIGSDNLYVERLEAVPQSAPSSQPQPQSRAPALLAPELPSLARLPTP